MARRYTQHELIRAYINDFGAITPIEAFQMLGVTKLATRISEMRADGEKIIGTIQTAKNRYGKTVRYMKYTME